MHWGVFEINNSFSVALNFMKKYKQAFKVGFSTFSMKKQNENNFKNYYFQMAFETFLRWWHNLQNWN